ncbi:MAG: hypothetical protein PHP32_01750 [Candidatus Izemoplasmatales bacterium]|nr:hypothetical protein [Candidatus Izemoplasmatales bacterium]
MKHFQMIIINDLKRYFEYRIFHVHIAISILFAASMAFFGSIHPSNFIFVAIFILPVVLFSISLFIEREEGSILPWVSAPCSPTLIAVAKMTSALLMQLIPFVLFSIVLVLKGYEFSYLLFLLAFLLGSLVHIVIGLSLSILSKSNQILSISYLIYIVLFSVLPIFHANGLIPDRFSYALIISPAYLSGILIDSIMAGSLESPVLLVILSVVLQLAYAAILLRYVIAPFFKPYLLDSLGKKE